MSNEIFLYDQIGGPTANAGAILPEIQAADPAQPITVRIHSPGGSVLDGEAILTNLRSHPSGFIAVIDGMAFSMAANIALEADQVRMAPDAWLMFHFSRSWEGGTAMDLARQKRVLDKMDESLLDKLEARLGSKNPGREELDKRLMSEWWVDGKEAMALGLADELTREAALAACKWPRPDTAPQECLEYLDNSRSNKETKREPSTFHEKIIFLARHR